MKFEVEFSSTAHDLIGGLYAEIADFLDLKENVNWKIRAVIIFDSGQKLVKS